MMSTPQSHLTAYGAITSTRLSIVKSPYLDPSQWRIEQILSKLSKFCCRQFEGKRCNVKIAKYHRPIVASMFIRIKK